MYFASVDPSNLRRVLNNSLSQLTSVTMAAIKLLLGSTLAKYIQKFLFNYKHAKSETKGMNCGIYIV